MPRHYEQGPQTKAPSRYKPVAERGPLKDTPAPAEGEQTTWNRHQPPGQPSRKETPEPLNPDLPVQTAMLDELHAQVNRPGTKNRAPYKAGTPIGYLPSQAAGLREPDARQRLTGDRHLQPSHEELEPLRKAHGIVSESRVYTTDMSYNLGGSTFGERMAPRTAHFEAGHKSPHVAAEPKSEIPGQMSLF